MYDRTKKRSRKRRRNTDNRTVHPGTHRINDKLYGKCTADCQKGGSGSAGTMLSAQDGNGRLSGGSGSDAVDRRTGESGDDRD